MKGVYLSEQHRMNTGIYQLIHVNFELSYRTNTRSSCLFWNIKNALKTLYNLIFRYIYLYKLTIKLTKEQAKKLLESLPENHKIKIKVTDLNRILKLYK
jgi:hypothetical protein